MPAHALEGFFAVTAPTKPGKVVSCMLRATPLFTQSTGMHVRSCSRRPAGAQWKSLLAVVQPVRMPDRLPSTLWQPVHGL